MYNNESSYTLPTLTGARQLEGMVAVVTGASGSLGRAITARLISEGAHVYAAGRSKERLAPIVDEMNKLTPGSCSALVLSMDDEQAVTDALEDTLGGEAGYGSTVQGAQHAARLFRSTSRIWR